MSPRRLRRARRGGSSTAWGDCYLSERPLTVNIVILAAAICDLPRFPGIASFATL